MAEHEGFTPGPWRVEPMDQTIPMFGITAGTGDWWIGYGFDKEADANLAADAPRLLAENARLREALKEARKFFDCEWDDCGKEGLQCPHCRFRPTLDSALSAAGEEG